MASNADGERKRPGRPHRDWEAEVATQAREELREAGRISTRARNELERHVADAAEARGRLGQVGEHHGTTRQALDDAQEGAARAREALDAARAMRIRARRQLEQARDGVGPDDLVPRPTPPAALRLVDTESEQVVPEAEEPVHESSASEPEMRVRLERREAEIRRLGRRVEALADEADRSRSQAEALRAEQERELDAMSAEIERLTSELDASRARETSAREDAERARLQQAEEAGRDAPVEAGDAPVEAEEALDTADDVAEPLASAPDSSEGHAPRPADAGPPVVTLWNASFDELRTKGLTVTQAHRLLRMRDAGTLDRQSDPIAQVPGFSAAFRAELRETLPAPPRNAA